MYPRIAEREKTPVSRHRFGYFAKAPSGERHAGCEDLYWRLDKNEQFGFVQVTREEWADLPPHLAAVGNVHPTVKRVALMRWLHKLAAPKGPIGDLAAGSASGAIAAHLDGHDWIGAEITAGGMAIARARLAFWQRITPTAAARFIADETVPERVSAPVGQASLFANT